MSKKTDEYYFDCFIAVADYACQIARELEKAVNSFDPTKLEEDTLALHAIEHAADETKNEMISELVRAFITPIERDDIIELAYALDDVVDYVEDVMINMNITQIQAVRDDCAIFSQNIVESCDAMKALLVEFKNFRKSKKIKEMIIEISHLEEVGDINYANAMKKLHAESKDPIEIIVWRDIYKSLEKVCDSVERVAVRVEGVVIGNL